MYSTNEFELLFTVKMYRAFSLDVIAAILVFPYVGENFFWDHFLGKLRDQAEFGNQALSSPHEPVGGYLRERVRAGSGRGNY